jgi:hypothetical protein
MQWDGMFLRKYAEKRKTTQAGQGRCDGGGAGGRTTCCWRAGRAGGGRGGATCAQRRGQASCGPEGAGQAPRQGEGAEAGSTGRTGRTDSPLDGALGLVSGKKFCVFTQNVSLDMLGALVGCASFLVFCVFTQNTLHGLPGVGAVCCGRCWRWWAPVTGSLRSRTHDTNFSGREARGEGQARVVRPKGGKRAGGANGQGGGSALGPGCEAWGVGEARVPSPAGRCFLSSFFSSGVFCVFTQFSGSAYLRRSVPVLWIVTLFTVPRYQDKVSVVQFCVFTQNFRAGGIKCRPLEKIRPSENQNSA